MYRQQFRQWRSGVDGASHALSSNERMNTWIMDSGVTRHMCNDASQFKEEICITWTVREPIKQMPFQKIQAKKARKSFAPNNMVNFVNKISRSWKMITSWSKAMTNPKISTSVNRALMENIIEASSLSTEVNEPKGTWFFAQWSEWQDESIIT